MSAEQGTGYLINSFKSNIIRSMGFLCATRLTRSYLENIDSRVARSITTNPPSVTTEYWNKVRVA